jgi:hypothetical protein
MTALGDPIAWMIGRLITRCPGIAIGVLLTIALLVAALFVVLTVSVTGRVWLAAATLVMAVFGTAAFGVLFMAAAFEL